MRGTAENEFGVGPDSAVNSINNVVLAPTEIVNPELEAETADSIKIKWNYENNVPGTKFQVWWDPEIDGEFKKIDTTSETFYEAYKVRGTRTYHFKVRVENECGESLFSPVLPVNIAFAPPPIDEVSVKPERCMAVVSWTKPSDRGSPLTSYTVAVRGATGAFHTIESCGYDVAKLDCQIPMQVLVSTPWNLAKGDVIYAKVFATNAKGSGEPTFSDDSYVIKTEPRKMPKPFLENMVRGTAYFNWEDFAQEGTGEDISYEVTV